MEEPLEALEGFAAELAEELAEEPAVPEAVLEGEDEPEPVLEGMVALVVDEGLLEPEPELLEVEVELDEVELLPGGGLRVPVMTLPKHFPSVRISVAALKQSLTSWSCSAEVTGQMVKQLSVLMVLPWATQHLSKAVVAVGSA
jgi:hypothetical protein